MGSSKIMANSLDDSVFDGVAREESVQSVLSAVSGGLAQEETAQEILEKVEGVNRSVESVSRRGEIYHYALTSEHQNWTPLSITGKGKLYYAYGYQCTQSTSRGTVSIIVDGRSIFTQYLDNVNRGANYYALTHREYFRENGYFYFAGRHENCYSPYNISPAYAIDENSNLVFDGTEWGSKSNTKYAVEVDGYIQFNQSLVITYTNCDTYNPSKVFACYSLDED